MVHTVFEKRDALKELFHYILEHYDEYDEDSVHCADGFKACLDDFQFCFLLHTFNGIFEYSDVLFSVLQDKKNDVQFSLARVKEFCDTVERERSRFQENYEATERTAGAPSARRGPAQDPCAHYRQLHSGRYYLPDTNQISRPRKTDLCHPPQLPEVSGIPKRFSACSLFQLSTEPRNTFLSASAKNRTDCNVCH